MCVAVVGASFGGLVVVRRLKGKSRWGDEKAGRTDQILGLNKKAQYVSVTSNSLRCVLHIALFE